MRERLIAIPMASSYNYHKPLGTDREEPQVDLYELGESCSQPQEHKIFFSVSFPHLFSHKLWSYSLAWHWLLITLLRRWEARRLGAWPGAIPEVPLSNWTAQAWPREDSLKAACVSLATEMSALLAAALSSSGLQQGSRGRRGRGGIHPLCPPVAHLRHKILREKKLW